MSLRLIRSNELTQEQVHEEARLLVAQIDDNVSPTNRDHFVYAYHFMRLGFPNSALTHLFRVDRSYFTDGIFKDLYRAVLAELVVRIDPANPNLEREYEFFIIAKRATLMFPELNLPPNLYELVLSFAEEFSRYSNFTVEESR